MAVNVNALVAADQQPVTLRPATRADLPAVEHLLHVVEIADRHAGRGDEQIGL